MKIPESFITKAQEIVGSWSSRDSELVQKIASALYMEYSRVKLSIVPLKTASYTDYFVQLSVDNRTIDVFHSKIPGRANYTHDCLKNVLYDTGKPHILDYSDDVDSSYELDRVSHNECK